MIQICIKIVNMLYFYTIMITICIHHIDDIILKIYQVLKRLEIELFMIYVYLILKYQESGD